MKRTRFLLAAMAWTCFASFAVADEPSAPTFPSGANPGWNKSAADWYIESVGKAVDLTDEQKKAIAAIFEARDKGMKDFQTQNADKFKAASDAMTEAFKSKNADVIAKAQKDYQNLYAPLHELMKRSTAELTSVLTAEQQAKLQDSQIMSMVRGVTAPVELSDDQLKKLKDITGRAMKDGDAATLWRTFSQTIQEVLTPEQKTTIAKHRLMSYIKPAYARANLTADQWKQIEAACDALIKAQDFNLENYWNDYKKIADKIGSLLTDEQKTAMQQPFWPVAKSGETAASQPASQDPSFEVQVRKVQTQLHNIREQLQAVHLHVTELDRGLRNSDREKLAQQRVALERAAALLTEAGRTEDAQRLYQEAHEIAKQLKSLGVRPDRAIAELRQQMEQMRKELTDLHSRLEKIERSNNRP